MCIRDSSYTACGITNMSNSYSFMIVFNMYRSPHRHASKNCSSIMSLLYNTLERAYSATHIKVETSSQNNVKSVKRHPKYMAAVVCKNQTRYVYFEHLPDNLHPVFNVLRSGNFANDLIFKANFSGKYKSFEDYVNTPTSAVRVVVITK